MNFTFSGRVSMKVLKSLGIFQLYKQRDPVAFHAMEGVIDQKYVVFFEYRYTTSDGESPQTWHYSVAFFPSGGIGLANLRLEPETFWQQLGRFFSSSGAADQNRPRALIGKNWYVEILRGRLLLYRLEKLSPQDVPGFIARANEIATALNQDQSLRANQ